MKTVNVVLAIGTLIILGALITLGIKAFYPEPAPPGYPAAYPMAPAPQAPCASNDVKCIAGQAQYQAKEQAAQSQYQADEQAYEGAMKVYDRNVFIVANLVGVIVFVVGFLTVLYAGLASLGVRMGIIMAGLWGIMYGYGRGWWSIDDRLKFFVGLAVAVLVIGGSMWLMQRQMKH